MVVTLKNNLFIFEHRSQIVFFFIILRKEVTKVIQGLLCFAKVNRKIIWQKIFTRKTHGKKRRLKHRKNVFKMCVKKYF